MDNADGYGATRLMRACRSGSFPEVKRLIDAGANVNAADHDGGTPLLYALAQHPNNQIIKLLLDAGADPSKKSREGYSPLCLEISEDNGDMKSVVMLLDHYADERKAATEALHCLVGFKSYQYASSKAEFLLSRGADANDRSPHNNIPLIVGYAGEGGDDRVLAVLLHKGHANVNAVSDTGETALMAAARVWYSAAINVLLDSGADCSVRNKQGSTALDLAKAAEPGGGRTEEMRAAAIKLLSACTTTK